MSGILGMIILGVIVWSAWDAKSALSAGDSAKLAASLNWVFWLPIVYIILLLAIMVLRIYLRV